MFFFEELAKGRLLTLYVVALVKLKKYSRPCRNSWSGSQTFSKHHEERAREEESGIVPLHQESVLLYTTVVQWPSNPRRKQTGESPMYQYLLPLPSPSSIRRRVTPANVWGIYQTLALHLCMKENGTIHTVLLPRRCFRGGERPSSPLYYTQDEMEKDLCVQNALSSKNSGNNWCEAVFFKIKMRITVGDMRKSERVGPLHTLLST